jgi:hypothetical protein
VQNIFVQIIFLGMEFPGMSIVHTAVTHMEISPAGTLKYKTGVRRQIFPCKKYLVSMSGMFHMQ